MLSFKQFINENNIMNEAMSNGVAFEWAIVYWALKSAGYTDEQLLERHANLHPYGEKIDSDAQKAISNIPFSLYGTAAHTDELGISGNPEPKTDVCFGSNHEYKISVKMSGAIQLASGEGKSSAATINAALNEYYKENPITDEKMIAIVEKIANMPTKMLTQKNLSKVKTNKFNDYITMTKDGEILPQFNWDKFKNENKQLIVDTLKVYVGENPRFLHILVHEALTGMRTFNNSNAAANWIITPKKFIQIDKEYVNHVIPKVKIDMRAKSRSGITSATLRFDYKTEGVILNFFKKVGKSIKNFFSKILNHLFDKKGEFQCTIPID